MYVSYDVAALSCRCLELHYSDVRFVDVVTELVSVYRYWTLSSHHFDARCRLHGFQPDVTRAKHATQRKQCTDRKKWQTQALVLIFLPMLRATRELRLAARNRAITTRLLVHGDQLRTCLRSDIVMEFRLRTGLRPASSRFELYI